MEPTTRDRGAVDVSLEMIFGAVALVALMLLVVEASSYWHSRNIINEAAAEGARIAAAFDGSCLEGENAARAIVQRRAANWADDIEVSCIDPAGLVTVTVSGTTPGVLFGNTGFDVSVSESAPSER